MCGIAFLFDSFGDVAERVQAATGLLHHRGPDAQHVFSSDHVALGHARLSIIDLESSQQPIQSPDGRYVLTFNGEIYNYQLLRNQLLEKWQFRTAGDTEVLLAGLVTEGVSFLNKMKGMWAFVLYDQQTSEVLLARDRFGKKPLFFSRESGFLAVASELPALKSLLPNQQFVSSESRSVDYLRYGFQKPGETIYQNVEEVRPGHWMRWRMNQNSEETEPYWNLNPCPFEGDLEEAMREVRRLFSQSIERRLVSDVEVGALLSGGIDSSLIVAVAKRDFDQNIKTFTVAFADKSYDEGEWSKRIAKNLGLKNTQHVVERFEVEELKKLLVNSVGQPFGDASLLPTSLACKLAGREVKVCLSGDGADEVFSGYQRYQGAMLASKLIRFPQLVRRGIASLVNSLPASHSHHSRSLVKKAQLFVNGYLDGSAFIAYEAPRLLPEKDWQEFFPDLPYRSSGEGETNPHTQTSQLVQSMMLRDLAFYLPQDILIKSDRASMAHSLELRSPFLDDDLVSFASSIPIHMHRNWTHGKCLLRSAFQDYLPKQIWNRRKQGFSVPLGDWFMGELGDELLQLKVLIDIPGVKELAIESMLKSHRSREQDYSHFLWLMYTYLFWRQNGMA